MAKLYEINREIEDLIRDNFDSETGMVNPDIQGELFSLELERDQKLLAIGKYVKNLESEANEHTEEKKRQDNKAKILQRKADRLREYISYNLNPGESFKDPQVSVGWSSRSSFLCDISVEDLPEKYIIEKVVRSIDKKLLQNAVWENDFEHPLVKIKYNLIIK